VTLDWGEAIQYRSGQDPYRKESELMIFYPEPLEAPWQTAWEGTCADSNMKDQRARASMLLAKLEIMRKKNTVLTLKKHLVPAPSMKQFQWNDIT